MRAERIAVLGAGGFLGSHLVPALLERFDCAIDAVDVDFAKLESSDRRVERIVARVEEPDVVEGVTRRCSLVLSLTALCNPALYSTMPLEVIDASFTHLLPLVKRCSERKVRLIHFSTAEVYGRRALNADGVPSSEMSEDSSSLSLGPISKERWSYACAKQLLERVIWAHGRHEGLPFTLIRPFNTIGPRMDYLPGVDGDGTPRVLACFIHRLLLGEPLQLVDGGQQKRSFMAVDDMVEAICRVVERAKACDGQIINLGNPRNNVSIAELGRAVAEAFAEVVPTANRARFESIPARDFYGPGYDDSTERVPDIRKARRLLSWEPRQSLSSMLPGIVQDYVARYGAALPPAELAKASSACA
jgi:UDP-apiose/xylose synthase